MPARTLKVISSKKTTPTNCVVLYARVSSKDQEREGYSIPAQLRLLREYAVRNDLIVAEEFVDVETAKQSGRTAFTAMLDYLKRNRAGCRTILVEKTDRLYRNLKDWTTLDDLGTTIHLVKEGRIIGPDSRSSDHLAHGINVLMARNYILNLAEETRKGMTEKARSGLYPSYAPVGYRNVIGSDGKRTIVSDPDTAPVIAEIFTRFAEGRHSVKALVKEMNSESLQLRGRRLQCSVVHQILRKRLYTGDFDWGRHHVFWDPRAVGNA
jgi:site-specific DNA recombinase